MPQKVRGKSIWEIRGIEGGEGRGDPEGKWDKVSPSLTTELHVYAQTKVSPRKFKIAISQSKVI